LYPIPFKRYCDYSKLGTFHVAIYLMIHAWSGLETGYKTEQNVRKKTQQKDEI